LDKLGSAVNELRKDNQVLNSAVSGIATLKSFADEIYMLAIGTSETLTKLDAKLEKFHGHRAWYILGCFAHDTLIQVDRAGKTVPIQNLYKGDLIWNPDLSRTIPITRDLMGPESGFIWEVKTSDGFAVNVTKTHPMKILQTSTDSSVIQKWRNIPICEVMVGNITVTINGQQEISSIRKIEIKDYIVYNLEYDIDDSIPIEMRTMIANGIQTLDFYAQTFN